MEIDPMTGEEMTKLMQEVYSSPKHVVARLAEALKKPNNVKLAPGAK
jgi:hypothetical protein